MIEDLYVDADLVTACADLAARTGASGFEIGHVHAGVPVEEAGWYAHVQFRGARIIVENKRTPTEAATALAERLLSGATCRCLKPVTLSRVGRGCRWKLNGDRWESSCNAPPLKNKGPLGDYGAIQKALSDAFMNRATRRSTAKHRKKP